MIKYIIVGYIASYLVIWSHEVGHAYFYHKFGCKDNFFKVTVPSYLIFSTPQPIDLNKAKLLSLKEKFIVGIGGILVNIIFDSLGFILIKNIEIQADNLYHFFWYSFVLFHLVEAASYTVLNNIFVASDIVEVQNYKPIYRIPLFLLGLVVMYFVINLLINSPQAWRLGLILVTCVLALLMGVLMVVFGCLMSKKQRD